MKLLFDQNLSPRLVSQLHQHFPGSQHVQAVGLERAYDMEVWDYARRNRLIIVTKDVDFSDRVALMGHPPKIIWIRMGNCAVKDIAAALSVHHPAIQAFYEDSTAGVFTIF